MTIKTSERTLTITSNLRGGKGEVKSNNFMAIEKMPAHYRLLSEVVLDPGCSIGMHPHEVESELYFILKGEAIITDDGTEIAVHPGDLHICYAGHTHGIANNGDEPVHFLAAIVTYA